MSDNSVRKALKLGGQYAKQVASSGLFEDVLNWRGYSKASSGFIGRAISLISGPLGFVNDHPRDTHLLLGGVGRLVHGGGYNPALNSGIPAVGRQIDPDNPGDPNNPGDPDSPGNPDNPGDPDSPGDPGNPDSPGNPNNPGGSNSDNGPITPCSGVGNFYLFGDRSNSPDPSACFPPPDPVSPIILDLNGDGVNASGATFFDHEGDGWAELTRWAGTDDGVLVWDKDGDGFINDGSELFGNNSVLDNGTNAAHGFAALAEFDGNGDGVVDSKDTGRDTNNDGVVDGKDKNWENLRVMRWTDANSNGIKESGEESLVSLASLNIRSLSTAFVNSRHVDSKGNQHRQVGNFTSTDGTTARMTDVWFVSAPGVAAYKIPDASGLSEAIRSEIQSLPQLKGGGRVYDLRDAMALDDATDADGNSRLTAPFYSNTRTETRSLRELVAAFSSSAMATDKAGRDALAEKILHRWAGAEGVTGADYWNGWSSASQDMGKTNAAKIAVVEAFQGNQWRKGESYRNPALSTAQKVNRIYRFYTEDLYARLMLQTHLKKAADGIVMSRKAGAVADSTNPDDYQLSFAKAAKALGTDAAKRGEFLRSLAAVYGENQWFIAQLRSHSAEWKHEYKYQFADLSTDIIRGGSGSDVLTGEDNLADVFDGDAGGNDTLYGYGGDDVYYLGAGTGRDTIREYSANDGDSGDEIRIKSGIAVSSVRLLRSGDGNHLHVQLVNAQGAATDSLTVQNYYTDASAKVESLVFGDGTRWDISEFAAARIRGSARGDYLYGEDNLADVFDGNAGGNDTLYGYGGNDVYYLGAGTGRDTIREYSANDGDSGDAIRVKSGIAVSSVRLLRSGDGNHLHVQLVNAQGTATDSLTVQNYYTDASAKVESLVFADGTQWGEAEFAAARIRGSARGDVLTGEDNLADVFDGDAGGNDTLYGYGGDDVYYLGAGTGRDTIREYSANDGDSGDEIRVKSGIAVSSVRLLRSGDGNHLHVQLVDAQGAATDSLTVQNYYTDASAKVESLVFTDGTQWGAAEFSAARIRGGSRGENLTGEDNLADVFDGDAGGNDTLYGYGGDDVYYLGAGTGRDTIREYSANDGDSGDEIRIKSGIAVSSVRLLRSGDGNHLHVQLVNAQGAATDSLTVQNYYTDASAKVESLVFADGTQWGEAEFSAARIRGGSRGENLTGEDNLADVFDGDAGGNDSLYGYGGNDVYYLGAGTGRDTIREYSSNDGDSGDEIRVKSGIAVSLVRLLRSGDGNHLHVQLVNAQGVATDSLTVENYYTDDSAKVESLVFGDGTRWDATEFAAARIRGGSRGENLTGEDNLADVFDGNAGGNDTLYGYGGNDVYYLGAGTGRDTILEYSSNDGDSGDEIRVKSGIAVSSVRLLRSGDGNHLHVQLVNAQGTATDSLTVENYYTDDSAKVESLVFGDGTRWGAAEFAVARIRGGSGNDDLRGEAGQNDVFDGDAGGNDMLSGLSGDDVYYLGAGTGDDRIYEYQSNDGDAGDEIRIKTGIAVSSVRLLRSGDGNHLHVQLVDAEGTATDSLTVQNYYTDASAKVEKLVFADGTEWGSAEFAAARIRGSAHSENLTGEDNLADVFDGDAGGNDRLYGYGGDDVYYLGAGTGDDQIYEYQSNDGDDGDEIRLEDGIGVSSVSLARNGNHLDVRLLDSGGTVTDSLRVRNHFSDASGAVEKIRAGGKVLLSSQYLSLISEMAAFTAGTSSHATMGALLGSYWQDETTLTTPGG